MSLMVAWLADAARLTGYPVAEVSGWRNRGHGGMTAVEGVVCHHTAGPRTGEYPSLQVVRDGRSDLPGPLANLGIGRSGTVYVFAAGLAYHAGASTWAGFSDLNYRFLGIEAESAGTGDWTPEQVDCYPRLVAALLYYMRRNADRACAHRECATPKGRKIDPTGIDMGAFRARVADLLADPLHRIPRTSTTSGGFLMALSDAQQQTILEAAQSQLFGKAGVRNAGEGALYLADLRDKVEAVEDKLDAILAKLDGKAV
ncbi:MAG: N-acetylmuramoyl-L-alanine amidase [Pseudonocardia sp.]|uniref:N-acetylmuramoyl-L-alanine amidase n=1 Tax=Actinomycetes TaxID=1760 RepID=UPI00086AD461|nr:MULTISPECIES: N-acetylmuramoyl-L-alanine amidase [Actinomycetes]MBN9108557.1 N-acetylmuramoyl-L-alanine amidase [Pseudonocardia sp.]ODU27437.1 MAG: hypothetical protein ABS80_03410 [Pseudonocardia sp. SCN 72-51]ODV07801.1 MAG: hypothetical protein ABT15_06910 [Pseudonocardia sp. SCN 73-27]